MNIVYDRSTLEHEKINLQTSIRNFLIGNTPDTEDVKVIQMAMNYIVKSHNSYYDQYYQIRTFQYAIDGLVSKYKFTAKTPSPNPSRPIMAMFDENESPF